MKYLVSRIYHPYWMWEEVKYNMWGSVDDTEDYLNRAVDFTGDHTLYGKYMMKAVKKFTYSCEHNLTNPTINKKAYIGHIACALAMKCPEDIVRKAWWLLTDEQRELADREAMIAYNYWLNKIYYKKYGKNKIE